MLVQSTSIRGVTAKITTQSSFNHRRSGASRKAVRVACQINDSDAGALDRRAAIVSLGAALLASNVSLPALAADEGGLNTHAPITISHS